MNSANPFQVPTCFQNVDEKRRRERIKKSVIATIVAAVLLLVGLLIQGCKSERAKVSSPQQIGAVTPAPAVQKPAFGSTMPSSNPGVMPQPMPSVSKASMTPTTSTTVYVIKSGDTLIKIAKTHGISVKTLKAMNGMVDDRIAVGAKLKVPTA